MLAAVSPYIVIFVLNLVAGAITTFGIGLALDSLSLDLIWIFIAIIAADTVSDTAYYLIGRFASNALQARVFRGHSKARRRYGMVKRYYDEHGASTIFLGKMSDILAVPAVLLAGASKMSYGFYIGICTGTSILKTFIILLAGYLISKSMNTADAHFVVYGIGGVFLVLLVVVFARHFYAMIKEEAKIS